MKNHQELKDKVCQVAKPLTDDLFGFTRQERDRKADKYREDIAALERGEITFWVPPTYINKIKKWL